MRCDWFGSAARTSGRRSRRRSCRMSTACRCRGRRGEVDGGGRAAASEAAPGGARPPEPSAPRAGRGAGAGGRFAARLVRGARAAPRADRVRRRRDEPAAGAWLFRVGDDAGVHGDAARASGGARPAGGAVLGPLRRVPGQPEGERGRADAVHAGARDAGHRADPRQHAAGEGAGGARQPDAAGSAREGDAAAGDRRDGGGERVPAGVHGGLQPALRGGAARGGGRAPSGSARRGGAGPDPVRAGDAEAVEEPDVPVRAARVPAGRRGQGPPPSRRGGDGVQGLRRRRGGAAQGRRLAFRVLAEGEAAVAVEDEKGVRDRVDAAKAAQAARPDWKPAPDHPWRRAFKPAAAERAAA